MIKEHDCVVLMQDLTGASLKAGDIGTVVHVHQGGAGYEVEFMTLAGETVTVAMGVTRTRFLACEHIRQLGFTDVGINVLHGHQGCLIDIGVAQDPERATTACLGPTVAANRVQATLEPVSPNVFKAFGIVIALDIECCADRTMQVAIAI